MVYLFISQPMSGRSDTEIIIEREELFEKAEKALYPEAVEEIESFWPDDESLRNAANFCAENPYLSHDIYELDAANNFGENSFDNETFSVTLSCAMLPNSPLYLLGRSISAMANADYIVFADGWENSRGCQIERACAEKYGVPILEV